MPMTRSRKSASKSSSRKKTSSIMSLSPVEDVERNNHIMEVEHQSHSHSNKTFHDDVCCEVTFDGLEKWYVNKFEKLGWMILADKHGHHDKVKEYKSSLKRLKEAIHHKLTHHITEEDRKHDLRVMHANVEILIEHVNKDFK